MERVHRGGRTRMSDRPNGPFDRLIRRPMGHELTLEQSRDRLSSYVYGNIILLTVTVAADPQAIEHGSALGTVLATAVTTFLAHVLAHLVGHGLGQDPDDDHARLGARDVLHGAVPILTSGLIPVALYAVGWAGWLPATAVQVGASVVLVVRIAMIGVFVQRFSGRRPSFLGLWPGIVLAAFALVIVVVKVTFTH